LRGRQGYPPGKIESRGDNQKGIYIKGCKRKSLRTRRWGGLRHDFDGVFKEGGTIEDHRRQRGLKEHREKKKTTLTRKKGELEDTAPGGIGPLQKRQPLEGRP